MSSRDYQCRQGRGMLFACSSSPSARSCSPPGLAKAKRGGKMQADAHAGFESVTEISRHRDRARGSNFSTRKTGCSTGWLSSEKPSGDKGLSRSPVRSQGRGAGMRMGHFSPVTCPHSPQTASLRQKPAMPGLPQHPAARWVALRPS